MKSCVLLATLAVAACSSRVQPGTSADATSATEAAEIASSTAWDDEEEIDWGERLFPTIAHPVPQEKVDPPPSQAPTAPPPPPLFASTGGEFYTSDHEQPIESKTVAEFCGTRRCKELPLPILFTPDKTYLGLKAIRVINDDGSAWSTLLLKTSAGLASVDVYWEVVDPEDPGCPSIFRGVSVESARLENGQLVIVTLGDSTTYVEVPEPKVDPNATEDAPAPPTDTGARLQLVRQVTIVKLGTGSLKIRDYPYWSGPALGYKLQPRGDKFLPWVSLPWKERRSFKVDQDGGLELTGGDPNKAP